MKTGRKDAGSGMEQLARMLAMMGSAHDGEVLNAARLAERARRNLNKSSSDLLAGDNGDAERRAIAAEGRLSLAEQRVADWRAKAERREQRAIAAEKRASNAEALCDELRSTLQNCVTQWKAATQRHEQWCDQIKQARVAERSEIRLECYREHDAAMKTAFEAFAPRTAQAAGPKRRVRSAREAAQGGTSHQSLRGAEGRLCP